MINLKGNKILIFVIIVVALTIAVFFASYFGTYAAKMVTFDITQEPYGEEVKVLNFNVRCIAIDDIGEKSWFYRADKIIAQIASEAPDIICFQEVTQIHQSYLEKCLVGYEKEFAYRSSGFSESTPIYYRSDRFEKISKGSFWLSDTPNIPSKFEDSSFNRICTYVKLIDKQNGKELSVFNTHLDHKGDSARIKGINVVINKINELNCQRAVLLGDMNDFEGSPMYVRATEEFDDAKTVATSTMDSITYNGYGKSVHTSPIDFCFATKGDFNFSEYKVLNQKFDGIYTSDHYPVAVKFTMRG